MNRAASGDGEGGGGRIAVTALLVLAVAIGMLLLVRARPEPGAFDPRSGRPDGTRALVLLLESQGVSVDVGTTVPRPGTATRVLIVADQLGDDQRADVVEFVEAGGVAVVADPRSTLHGATSDVATSDGDGLGVGAIVVTGAEPGGAGIGDDAAAAEANVPRGDCTIPALARLRGVFVPDGVLFPVGPDDVACFARPASGSDPAHAFVILRPLGTGTVVGLGDNQVLTNAFIRYADNSGLGVALLAPTADQVVVNGARSVTVVIGDRAAATPADLGSGEETLRDLVRPGVWMALTQLALAFVVLAAARGIRAGKVATEPVAVEIAGSEAVSARATVMQRAGHAARAGAVLRGDLHRELCERLALPRGAAIDAVAAAAASASASAKLVIDRQAVIAVLTTEVHDNASLLELSRRIAVLRATLDAQPQARPHEQGSHR